MARKVTMKPEHSEHWRRTQWEASGGRFSGVPFLPTEDATSAELTQEQLDNATKTDNMPDDDKEEV